MSGSRLSSSRRLATPLLAPLLLVVLLGTAGCGDSGDASGGGSGGDGTSGKLGAPASGPTESVETDGPDETEPTETDGTDDPDVTLTKPANLSDAESALADWLIAFGEGRGDDACALQTKNYTADLIRLSVDGDYVDKGTSCPDTVEKLTEFINDNGGLHNFELDTVSESGDKAEISVEYETIGADESYEMKRVGGEWLVHKDLT